MEKFYVASSTHRKVTLPRLRTLSSTDITPEAAACLAIILTGLSKLDVNTNVPDMWLLRQGNIGCTSSTDSENYLYEFFLEPRTVRMFIVDDLILTLRNLVTRGWWGGGLGPA